MKRYAFLIEYEIDGQAYKGFFPEMFVDHSLIYKTVVKSPDNAVDILNFLFAYFVATNLRRLDGIEDIKITNWCRVGTWVGPLFGPRF